MAIRWEATGAAGGELWDDGYEYDAVTKIQVGPGAEGIHYIDIEYVKNGLPVTFRHGGEGQGHPSELFEINHPEEYLVNVKFWFDLDGAIYGLILKSNKKTSDVIGYNDKGLPFEFSVLESEKIIGFHGYAGDEYIHSFGIYTIPLMASKTEDSKKELE